MAKETMIVFVYDTIQAYNDETDDPTSAVLYFHPSWVSDTQKVALCGQLMGTAFFLKDCFGKPRVLALENGKFVVREFGRFIVAVGTDRNIPDYILEYRADLLSSLLRLFHRDLQTVYDQITAAGSTTNPVPTSRKKVSERFYHIFETYLPMLQHKGNIFQNELQLRMPNTGGNIFMEAIQTLQECQHTKGILGGAILYHNKVVATQLDSTITKQLVLSDPLHVRNTAEHLHAVDFHIPNGVQMLVVYVKASLYHQLAADAKRVQSLPLHKTNPLPNFHVAKRKLKRDPSLIFTNIPEEEVTQSTDTKDKQENTSGTESEVSNNVPIRPKSLLKRPNHLSLRSLKCHGNDDGLGISKELPESGIASINFDETDSFPEFIGRTSICSTPMTENKVLPVMRPMSICLDPEVEVEKPSIISTTKGPAMESKRHSMRVEFERFFQNFLSQTPQPTEPFYPSQTPENIAQRRSSLDDLHNTFRKLSRKISLKRRSAPSKTEPHDENSEEAQDLIENDNSSMVDKADDAQNENEQIKTRTLFHEFLDKYYKLWDAGVDGTRDEEITELIAQFKEFDSELKELDASLRSRQRKNGTMAATFAKTNESKVTLMNEQPCSSSKDTQRPQSLSFAPAKVAATPSKSMKIQAKTPLEKRALTLPLKQLADAPTPLTEPSGSSFAAPLPRRPMGGGGGVPLTPLMAKLSVLAMYEERIVWDGGSTPGMNNSVEIQTPLSVLRAPFPRRSSLKCDDAFDALSTNLGDATASGGDGDLQKLELYLCEQQNMTLLLLMEENCSRQQTIVQELFALCVATFPQMETTLNHILSVSGVEGEKRDSEYSYMCLDTHWDSVQRAGPWNPHELSTLDYMHRDLKVKNLTNERANLTDLIVRSSDTVYYGCKWARSEYFYKEPAFPPAAGVPPPSDPLATVPMRAKTRLENDHSYVLF